MIILVTKKQITNTSQLAIFVHNYGIFQEERAFVFQRFPIPDVECKVNITQYKCFVKSIFVKNKAISRKTGMFLSNAMKYWLQLLFNLMLLILEMSCRARSEIFVKHCKSLKNIVKCFWILIVISWPPIFLVVFFTFNFLHDPLVFA